MVSFFWGSRLITFRLGTHYLITSTLVLSCQPGSCILDRFWRIQTYSQFTGELDRGVFFIAMFLPNVIYVLKQLCYQLALVLFLWIVEE